MRDIDRQLLLVREIETRIAFVELYLAKQQALIQRLAEKNLASLEARELYRVMQGSLAALDARRKDLMQQLVLTPPPTELDASSTKAKD